MPGPAFPANNLGLLVELQLNGTWTDISTYVYYRDQIVITRGRSDESSTITPAAMALTLNNRDGRFSPKNTAGAFYPFIGRNTQIRVSVNATSANATAYSGYRFWGEVSAWPPRWDNSGNDIYVTIAAAGIMRRLQQNASIGSSIRRYIMLQTGNLVPVAYWPMEEGSGAGQFGNLITPGNDLTWSGQPTLASDTGFLGSDPIPLLSLSALTGSTGSFSTSGDDIYTTPGTHSWFAAFTGTVNAKVWGAGGGGSSRGKGSGAGGEFSQNTAVAVTIGNFYSAVVGAAGTGGSNATSGPNAGTAGANSSFTAGATVVTGHGGGGGPTSGTAAGGTGSAAPTHFNGGAGVDPGGGGSSAGTASAGNPGGTVAGGGLYPGGAAVTGGGPGGTGSSNVTPGNAPVSGPGGGGGCGGIANVGAPFGGPGGNGYAGKVELIYSSGSIPPAVVTRCLLSIPAAGCVNAATILRTVLSSGTIAKMELYYGTGGKLGLRGITSGGGTTFDSGVTAFSADGQPLLVSMELGVSGSSVTWKLTAIIPGAGSVVATASGSYTGTLGAASQVLVNPASTIDDTAVGHITVQYALDAITNLSAAVNGHNDELAGARFTRLCTESGITTEFNGSNSDTPLMGPQLDKKLADLLQEVEDCDRGQLFEPRDTFGMGYSTRVSLMNQTASVAAAYTSATLAGDLEPTTDDQLVRNDVTVSRVNGATVNVTLGTGALSVQDPPAGVGDYSFSLSANVNADSQIANLAQWILDVGTVDEYRYPSVTFNMARSAVQSLFASIPGLDIGDYFTITSPPSFLTSSTIKQLAFGFTEVLNALTWTIEINAVPESVYEGAGLTW